MKKIIIFAMLLSIFLLSFSGCSSAQSDGQYEIKLAGFSDSVLSTSYFDKEYDGLDMISFFDENAAPTIQMTVGDFVFEGNYKETIRKSSENYYSHGYISQDNKILYISEDGRIVQFSFEPDIANSIEDFEETDKVYTKEECEAVAYNFMENVLELDVEQYTLFDSYPKYNESTRTYEFSFVKYANEWKTADQLRIYVAEENGVLYRYTSFMLNRMPTDVQVNFDIEEIEHQITAKLDDIFADCGRDDTEYSIYDYKLTKDEDDNYMLIIRVKVTYIEVSEDGTRYRQGGDVLKFVAWEN